MGLKKYKFSDLYRMNSGISSKPEQAGHGAPFCSFTTVFNNYFLPLELPDWMDTSVEEQETYSLKAGDILLTRTSETLDELGMSCVAVKDYPLATYSGFLKRLRPTQDNISYHKFMAFYLRSPLFRKTMNNNAVMTLRCSLNEQIFSYLEILLPKYDQQIQIGDLLHQIYVKTELNNRINVELEGIAKLLYGYWFVQFDFPITAAQASAMNAPQLEGKPYRSSGGKMVYNENLKREIPAGWEDGSLLDVATFTNGIVCQKYPPDSNETLRVIKIKEMRNGFTSGSDIVTTNIPEAVKIQNGDILFSWSASLEVMIWAGGAGALNQHIFKVTSDSHPRSFSYFVLLDYLRHFRMMAELRKTTMGHITRDHLEQSRIPIPDSKVSVEFEEMVDPIIERMMKAHEENRQLTELRNWLLPMLMNGQVTAC